MSIRHRATKYEADPDTFTADAYRVKGWPAVAWTVLGWETRPDQDTEWTGIESRTGKVLAVMVGDDTKNAIDEDDLVPLEREAYCGACGQLRCGHDGLDRSDVASK